MAAAKNHRILIVEDDALLRDALATVLRGKGCQVSIAGTLAEGLAALASMPHAIILDLGLPDGDGAEILRQVREQKLPIRVVVLSVAADRRLTAGTKPLTPDACLNKPFPIKGLLSSLNLAA